MRRQTRPCQTRPRLTQAMLGLLLLPLLLFITPTGKGQSPDQVPEPVQVLADMLERFETLYASFTQKRVDQTQATEVAGNATEEGNTQAGELWLQKPNMFRLETGPPLSQTVVSDGASLWTYDRDLEQVIISNFEDDLAGLPILLLGGSAQDLAAAFAITGPYVSPSKTSDPASRLFLLIPYDDKSILSSVAIVFIDAIPRTIILEDTMQARTFIELSHINLSPELSGSEFLFAVPESVDVIDDRH